VPGKRSRTPARPPRKRPAAPRRRRSADDAKRAILDAAEARFAARGPEGIRLQEIAADVGVAHPTILHHFGSRADLVRAVMDRALGALREELLATLGRPDPEAIDVAALLERVFETLGDHGAARLLAWLVLAGDEGRDRDRVGGAPFVREIAETVHARRRALYTRAGRRAPPFEDSLFAILLTSFALIGDALLGDVTRRSSGLVDPAAGRRFRAWFSQLLVAHLAEAGTPAAGAERAPRPGAGRPPRPRR